MQVYLNNLNLNYSSKISIAQAKRIFLTAIGDYKDGILSLEDLDDISGFIFMNSISWRKVSADDPKLAEAVYAGCELVYYAELATHPRNYDPQKIVSEYYEQHKRRHTASQI